MPVAEVDTEPVVVVEGDVAAIPFPQAEQNNNEPEAELARDLGLVMLKEDRPEHLGRQTASTTSLSKRPRSTQTFRQHCLRGGRT